MDNLFQQHGAFSWGELMTTDPTAAKEFYQKVFGWTMEDMPMEGMTYTVVKAGERSVGGIMPIPPQAKGESPAWGNYVTVEDVDASVKLVKELGGKILVPPTDIPDTGRFCLIQDPQGATISMITYTPM
ncbi:VOC family protein [Lusitaniella coriacea LEGE 07157]|uniref:VOC family protein n=1 Tax=Lusitaniella coriacea LEGE 07157 TaxID=945747 RepID=A0A8J7IUS0_9CYAN|nr:VOC family protein [Lusitaniella coriacea]MBE9116728.1 VOC family protein [Lusitaniella coriacea LEGE 07157]